MPSLPYSYIPGKKDCPICGIVSFAHEHPVDTKPKDFVTDDLKLCPGCTTMKHISDDGLECARCAPKDSEMDILCTPETKQQMLKRLNKLRGEPFALSPNIPELLSECCGAEIKISREQEPSNEFPFCSNCCRPCDNSLRDTKVEKDWWMKYAEGNWVGVSNIPRIIEEATKRGIEQERGRCVGIVKQQQKRLFEEWGSQTDYARGSLQTFSILLSRLNSLKEWGK